MHYCSKLLKEKCVNCCRHDKPCCCKLQKWVYRSHLCTCPSLRKTQKVSKSNWIATTSKVAFSHDSVCKDTCEIHRMYCLKYQMAVYNIYLKQMQPLCCMLGDLLSTVHDWYVCRHTMIIALCIASQNCVL